MYSPVGFALTQNQINKLQKAKQTGAEVTLELSPSQIGGQHDLYLTNRQLNKLERGAARIKFSKTQVKAQKGGFLGALAGLATKILPKVLPILGTLGLSAASGAISGATHKAAGGGIKRAGGTIPLHFNKGDISDIIKVVDALESNGMTPSGSCEECMVSIQKQEGGFIGALLATLAGSLLPSLLGGKGLARAGHPMGRGLRRAGSKKN